MIVLFSTHSRYERLSLSFSRETLFPNDFLCTRCALATRFATSSDNTHLVLSHIRLHKLLFIQKPFLTSLIRHTTQEYLVNELNFWRFNERSKISAIVCLIVGGAQKEDLRFAPMSTKIQFIFQKCVCDVALKAKRVTLKAFANAPRNWSN